MGRRRTFGIAAALSGALLLVSATGSLAQWREGGREGGRGGGREGARGAERYGGGAWGGRGGDAASAFRAAGAARYAAPSGYPPPRGYPAPSGYGMPRGYPAPPGYEGGAGRGGSAGWRRGQVLPPNYRDAYVADPGRYHLRAAPPGYGWVGDGRNAYLTQRSTGMVLDSVPGAYEPAPAYGRGRGRRAPR